MMTPLSQTRLASSRSRPASSMIRMSPPVKQWVRMSPGRMWRRTSVSVGGPQPMWTMSGTSQRSAASRARCRGAMPVPRVVFRSMRALMPSTMSRFRSISLQQRSTSQ